MKKTLIICFAALLAGGCGKEQDSTEQATGVVIGSYANGFVSILMQVDSEYPIGQPLKIWWDVASSSRNACIYTYASEPGVYPNLIQVQWHLVKNLSQTEALDELEGKKIAFSYRPYDKDKDRALFTFDDLEPANGYCGIPNVPICTITNYKILNN